MSEKRKFELARKREIRPYADLWYAANVLERQANEDRAGSTWKLISYLLLTAFAWEAFLNQLGAAKLKSWTSIERKLSTPGKLLLLAELIGVEIDFSSRPYKGIRQLLKFRNALAHPKPNSIESALTIFDNPENIDARISEPLETDWEKLCKPNQIRRIREDVEAAIRHLHKVGNVDHPVFTSGISSDSAKLKNAT